MKLVSLLLVGIAVLTAGLAFSTLRRGKESRKTPIMTIQKFVEWQKSHGKLYASPAEADYRLQVFAEQLAFVDESNLHYDAAVAEQGGRLSGPMFEMNAFGDLGQEEFAARYTGGLLLPQDYIQQDVSEPSNSSHGQAQLQEPTLGQSNFVPKIRSQGSCGSCWAFSTIVEIERALFVSSGSKYVDLSQQELVDCDTRQLGCKGGWPEYAFNYIRQYGIHTASGYPYKSAQGDCQKANPGSIKFPTFENCEFRAWTTSYSSKLNEKQVHSSVGLYSSGKFRYLSKTDDVFDASLSGDCDQNMNHLVAQQSFTNGVARIVNSWGVGWGFGGFKKIKPCSDTNLLGKGARLAHPWSSIRP